MYGLRVRAYSCKARLQCMLSFQKAFRGAVDKKGFRHFFEFFASDNLKKFQTEDFSGRLPTLTPTLGPPAPDNLGNVWRYEENTLD